MQFGVVGLNFKSASIELREKVAKTLHLVDFLPCVILSTCNRVEFYFSEDGLIERQLQLFAFFREVLQEEFEPFFYSYFQQDAFFHLCQVTAGLDSALLGETEIQGQVKRAYLVAKEKRALSKSLHIAFQKALQLGKWMRLQMELPQDSLRGAVWRYCFERVEQLQEQHILFVGFSKTNRALLPYFFERGARYLSLCTSYSSVEEKRASIVGKEALRDWQDYDVIISAAGDSKEYLIQGKGKGQLVLDLSVPRTVDPKIEGVVYGHLDQLPKNRMLGLEEQRELLQGKVEQTFSLKFGMSHIAREGNYISDVFEPSYI